MKAVKTSRAPKSAPAAAPSHAAISAATERLRAAERRGLYMMWFDDSAKKTATDKIEEAVAAYMRHFNARPNVVLVNESDRVEVSGVRVRSESYVRRDNFWIGYEDAA
ncbi:MAG: hypothetical protein RLZZ387_1644 [Chloroflexota bacterium]